MSANAESIEQGSLEYGVAGEVSLRWAAAQTLDDTMRFIGEAEAQADRDDGFHAAIERTDAQHVRATQRNAPGGDQRGLHFRLRAQPADGIPDVLLLIYRPAKSAAD